MTPSDSSPAPTDAPHVAEPGGLYEFTSTQNRVIGLLGQKMHFVGLVSIAVGLTAIVLGAMRRDAGIILTGALYAVVGLWTERAGTQFRTVVLTQGDDIRHLMSALDDLRKLYTVQYWILLAALFAAIVLLLAPALR